MKKTIETFILFVLAIVLTVLICRLIYAGKQPEIIKEKEVVTIEGKIKYVSTEKEVIKPYKLVVERLNDDWRLNEDLSYIPIEMSVDSVKGEGKFDPLGPARIGGEYNLEHGFRPVIGYNPIRIDFLEAGAITNFKSIGLNISAKFRNTSIFGAVYLDKSIGVGVSFRF